MKIRIGYGLGTQGLAGEPRELAARYGRFVDDLERLGFDSVWFSERLTGEAPDPVVAMAHAAGRTSKLKFGMSVMVLPGRSPALVAKEIASLDVLSGGRVLPAFGLGAADPREHAAFAVAREDRAAMFNESLALIRRFWTGEPVTHEGRFYRYDAVTVRPLPVQSPPDVWLGGIAPSELRRVGRVGDGWLPSFVTPSEASAAAVAVRSAAAEAGREIDPEHFGALIAYSSGKPLGGPLLERLRARRKGGDPAEVVPVGMDAVRAMIEAFVANGFSKFVLIPIVDPGDLTAELELVGESVLPLET
jgi:probable F420-dependent oxidoreductase